MFIINQDSAYVPIHDHNGNLCCLVDPETGSTQETYRYTTFGEETIYAEGSPSSPWRFSSKRKDGNLVHFTFRDYDPLLGRWITPDPLGFADGPNLYAYVHNNPLTHIDMHGLATMNLPSFSWDRKSLSSWSGYTPSWQSKSSNTYASSQKNSDAFNPFKGLNKYKFPPYVDFSGLAPKMPRQHAERFDLGRKEYNYKKRCITFVNGLGNTLEDAESHARYISGFAGNTNVHGVHKPDNGFADVRKSYHGLYRGKCGTTEKALKETWNHYFDNSDSDSEILQLCNSYGAIATRNALEDMDDARRNRITVVVIAPAAYISDDICKNARHYTAQGHRDCVPRFDKIGEWSCRHSTQMLPSHPDAKRFDHGFQSPTYAKDIKRHVREHLQME